MKKLLLTTAMFLSVNAFSQIKDLQDLLNLSRLTVFELPENLHGNWEAEMPFQKQTENRNIDIKKYRFRNKDQDQVIEREKTFSNQYNFTLNKTNFYSNDLELLEKIKNQLPEYGYKKMKSLAPYYQFYGNGKSSITIIDKQTKEAPTLKKGYYVVGVSLN